MELSILLFKNIAIMLSMVLIGFVMVKCKLLKTEDTVALSAINMYAVCPCVLISSFQLEYSPERLAGLGIAFVGGLLANMLFIVITKPVGNVLRLDNIDRASLIYTNGGNLIVPLINSMLGKEYVFLSSAFLAVQVVLVWAHLPGLICRENKLSLKKVLTNPNIIAIAVGLILFIGRINLPPLVSQGVGAMGDVMGPLCMMLIGMLMADTDLKSTFSSGHNWFVCVLRLIAYPMVFIVLVWLTRITKLIPMSRDVLVVTILAAAAPIGVAVAQMAALGGVDARKAGAINVMSVLLCIITMPLMILIYQLMC